MSGGDQPLVAVLDYGIGNLRSAQKALELVGADARLTADAALVADAAGVVLPGVGAFGRCMEGLRDADLDKVAIKAIAADVPFLGICVGMQLLYEGSEESPERAGLGVLAGTVRRLPEGVKHPQMQWNVVDLVGRPALANGLDRPLWAYFVHSFAPPPGDHVVATCDYGGPVVAAVQRGRLWATQFHPEKSGRAGLGVLANFVASLS
ncbi:imidazole glycerol phosphate synthase subunit HisH [soil metagenome]